MDVQAGQNHIASELSDLVADVLDESIARLADQAWLGSALEAHSLMDVVVAIERRYGVRFTDPQLVEVTCLADLIEVAAATAPCCARRPASLPGLHDGVDPGAFDW
jgi:acyl carrier protein